MESPSFPLIFVIVAMSAPFMLAGLAAAVIYSLRNSQNPGRQAMRAKEEALGAEIAERGEEVVAGPTLAALVQPDDKKGIGGVAVLSDQRFLFVSFDDKVRLDVPVAEISAFRLRGPGVPMVPRFLMTFGERDDEIAITILGIFGGGGGWKKAARFGWAVGAMR